MGVPVVRSREANDTARAGIVRRTCPHFGRVVLAQMTTHDFGPLPRADGGSQLQRESLQALHGVLPVADWIFRDSRVEDYGVDVELEVLANGDATHFRGRVQLKGRTGVTPNKDGSHSVSVETSNLNYLLNAPTPIYILYRPEDRSLWYLFAREEWRRIESENERWKEQQTVTLRFAKSLDDDGLEVIRKRIIDEAVAARKLQDMALSLAPGTKIPVDAGTLEPNSPVETERFLLEHGLPAVICGFGNKVLEMCEILPGATFRAHPKLLLIQGYAEFSRGHYVRADAPLRDALLAADKLTADDKHFLTYLVESINLALSYISADEFRIRMKMWRSNAPVVMAAQYDLLECWLLRTAARTEQDARQRDSDLRAAIDRVRQLTNAPDALRHQAELLLLFSEAQEKIFTLSNAMVSVGDSRFWNRRFVEPPPIRIKRLFDDFVAWRGRVEAIVRTLYAAQDIPLLCHAMYTWDLCEEMFLDYWTTAAQLTNMPLPIVPEALMTRVRGTAEFAGKHAQVEIALRAELVESELEDLRGNTERSRTLATAVANRAHALRFADIERVARRALEEGGVHSTKAKEIAAHAADGCDSWFLELSAGEQEEKVQETLQMLNLPAEAAPLVREELECHLDAARVRRDWCRHLEILERDTSNAIRPFARAPERCCHCTRFGWKSMVTFPDWKMLVTAFKDGYCADCSAREPKKREKV